MAKKRVIIPSGGAKPLAPYSPGIRYGKLVFTSGQVGIDPASGKLAEGGVAAQAKQALLNLQAVLEAAGCRMEDVLKCTVFMRDMADYGAINEVYGQFFTENPPARSAVAVLGLPIDALVEVEAVAIRRKKKK
ncbi:MAG: RidA family protein [Anaerolineales bacterium]|nr:RidA family protein [Anaerolineales bacterium]